MMHILLVAGCRASLEIQKKKVQMKSYNLDGSNDQMSNADTMFGCCSILKLLPSSEDADDSAAAPVVALAQSASRVSPLGAELLR